MLGRGSSAARRRHDAHPAPAPLYAGECTDTALSLSLVLLTAPPTWSLHRREFTDTALSLSLVLLNSAIDLVSFSGILYSIYPPLFLALVGYALGGTGASVWLGKVRAAGVAWPKRVFLSGWAGHASPAHPSQLFCAWLRPHCIYKMQHTA